MKAVTRSSSGRRLQSECPRDGDARTWLWCKGQKCDTLNNPRMVFLQNGTVQCSIRFGHGRDGKLGCKCAAKGGAGHSQDRKLQPAAHVCIKIINEIGGIHAGVRGVASDVASE